MKAIESFCFAIHATFATVCPHCTAWVPADIEHRCYTEREIEVAEKPIAIQ